MTDWRTWLGAILVIAAVMSFAYVVAAIVTRVIERWERGEAKRQRDEFDRRIASAARQLERRRHAAIRAYLDD